jgi:hypothetical protein
MNVVGHDHKAFDGDMRIEGIDLFDVFFGYFTVAC